MKTEYPNRIKIPGTQWYKNQEEVITDWGPSLTSQEFKDDCDTEKILQRYSNAGLPLPSVAVEHVYKDCTDMRNLQEHLNNSRALLEQAEEGFMMLDAKIRRKFDNDVAKMAEWLADPENDEESRKLGLRTQKVGDPVPPSPLPPKEEKKGTDT